MASRDAVGVGGDAGAASAALTAVLDQVGTSVDSGGWLSGVCGSGSGGGWVANSVAG